MTLKNTSKVWKKIILPEASSILDAAKNLEENGVQIVLVVDKKKCLVGTVSDGDIRRGLLNAGFKVSKVSGYGKKKEISYAIKKVPISIQQYKLNNTNEQITDKK